MHREIPVSNRVLHRKWEEQQQAFHYDRLKSVKASVDNVRPVVGTSRAKSKKEQMEMDRVLGIEQENKKLFERMSAIINSKPHVQTAISRGKSLNRDYRKKELERVTLENQALLRRLQNRQSSYSTEQWRHERKETERLLRNICHFPYVLGNESPTSIKRQMSQPQLFPSLPESARPRALPPIKKTPSHLETVFKRGLSLNDHYFLVEVQTVKEKVKLKALDVESQDQFLLKMTKAEVREVVGDGEDRYEKLVSRLTLQKQGLVLVGKPKARPKPAEPKEALQENKEEVPDKPKEKLPKAPLKPPKSIRKHLDMPSPHVKSEPNLTIPRKQPVREVPAEPKIDHFPHPKTPESPAKSLKSEKNEVRKSQDKKQESEDEYDQDQYEEDAVSPPTPPAPDRKPSPAADLPAKVPELKEEKESSASKSKSHSRKSSESEVEYPVDEDFKLEDEKVEEEKEEIKPKTPEKIEEKPEIPVETGKVEEIESKELESEVENEEPRPDLRQERVEEGESNGGEVEDTKPPLHDSVVPPQAGPEDTAQAALEAEESSPQLQSPVSPRLQVHVSVPSAQPLQGETVPREPTPVAGLPVHLEEPEEGQREEEPAQRERETVEDVKTAEKLGNALQDDLEGSKELSSPSSQLAVGQEEHTHKVQQIPGHQEEKPEEQPMLLTEVPTKQAESPEELEDRPEVQMERPMEHVEMPEELVERPVELAETQKEHVESPMKLEDRLMEQAETPTKQVESPVKLEDRPMEQAQMPKEQVEVPKEHVEVPKEHFEVPKEHVEMPKEHVEMPKKQVESPMKLENRPMEQAEMPKEADLSEPAAVEEEAQGNWEARPADAMESAPVDSGVKAQGEDLSEAS